jgi:hypothetical protein
MPGTNFCIGKLTMVEYTMSQYATKDDLIADMRKDIDRLMRCIDMAMGCLNPDSENRDEALAWHRLYDAEMGREPRASLTTD